jgi:isopenicillin N synthase-like dioxygenase
MKSGVPVVDLEPFRSGGEQDKRRVARAVDEACREIGFLVVVGHGVPADLLARAHTIARAFFDLNLETKQKYDPLPGGFPGYRGIGTEGLAYSLDQETPPDLKEAFTIGREDIGDDPYFACEQGRLCFKPNVWPTEVPEFKETWAPLYRAFDALATEVMRIFALGLDLPLHFFDGAVDKAVCALRAQLSRAGGEAVAGSAPRRCAHGLRHPHIRQHGGRAGRARGRSRRRGLGGGPRSSELVRAQHR